MFDSFVSDDCQASMNVKVGATCRPPAASCTSGVCRFSGTDEWKQRAALWRQVAPLEITDYWVSYRQWELYSRYLPWNVKVSLTEDRFGDLCLERAAAVGTKIPAPTTSGPCKLKLSGGWTELCPRPYSGIGLRCPQGKANPIVQSCNA